MAAGVEVQQREAQLFDTPNLIDERHQAFVLLLVIRIGEVYQITIMYQDVVGSKPKLCHPLLKKGDLLRFEGLCVPLALVFTEHAKGVGSKVCSALGRFFQASCDAGVWSYRVHESTLARPPTLVNDRWP